MTNRIIERPPGERPQGPLSDRERAARKLRDSPGSSVEVLGDGGSLTITGFVFDMGYESEHAVLEYFCTTCHAHAIVYNVRIVGMVTCSCGSLIGKPI